MPVSTDEPVGMLYYNGQPLCEVQSLDMTTFMPLTSDDRHNMISGLHPVETSFSMQLTPDTVRAFARITHTDLPRMKRKRFMKLLMSYGWGRNAARKIALYYQKRGMSWAEAWQDCRREIWPGVSFIFGPRGSKEECK